MKREDLKQMAIEAGFDVAGVQGFLVATGLEGTQDHKLRKLISLVEQATLERAAKVCEEISDEYARTESLRYPELKTDAETGASDCEDAIRALKDSHE